MFKIELDLKRHYLKAHKKKYLRSSKYDKLAQADKNYQSLETDLPDVDISVIPREELRGKKISTIQAKSIKGLHMIYNESTKLQ